MQHQNNDKLQCLVLGTSCVGKTTLCNILQDRPYIYPYIYPYTCICGVDYGNTFIERNGQKPIHLTIYDCSGDIKYYSLIVTYITKKIDLYIFVHDYYIQYSLEYIKEILPCIEMKRNSNSIYVLVTNYIKQSSNLNTKKSSYNDINRLIENYNMFHVNHSLNNIDRSELLDYLLVPILFTFYKKYDLYNTSNNQESNNIQYCIDNQDNEVVSSTPLVAANKYKHNQVDICCCYIL